MTNMDEASRRRSMAQAGRTDVDRWRDPAALSPSWNGRAQRAAEMIPRGARVLDFGCGAMALEAYLPAGCAYLPCDLAKRDDRTIVCDFNAGEFPDASCDVASVLGVLEYLNDVPDFLQRLRALRAPVIVSYNPTDLAQRDRRALGWVNDYTRADLRRMFTEAGFAIGRGSDLGSGQILVRLEVDHRASVTEKIVWVISASNVENFGDRLGLQLLSQVLPAHAQVRHIHHKPFLPPPAGEADLLIYGLGNSLFAPYLTDELIDLADRAQTSIGIFGTQYRAAMPNGKLEALLDRLHTWYARYEEDALTYGRGRTNVRHLGDWLIDAFPMACPTEDSQLVIDSRFPLGGAPDRIIRKIQSHRSVVSARLHPLLCALTSAEQVGFAEQRAKDEWAQGLESGKFRSMLMDVFGAALPEEGMWKVDRPAVVAYKQRVARNIAALRSDLARLLG